MECLSTELKHCKMQLQQAESNKIVERSEEDVKLIEEKDENIEKLKGEVSYIKKELIDARSRKAAAEDELNTVKGTVETINNSSKALSNEIEQLNETINNLTKKCEEETARADHLDGLVAAMEAQPGIEAKSKVEIADLKAELATSQKDLKAKIDEIQGVKDRVREKEEIVQQKEIEISRLNGQVQFIEEEMELIKSQSGDVNGLQAEINTLKNKLNHVMNDLEETRSDNVKLSSELQQMQVLYSELKKMRGRGEELELLEAAQRDVVEARDLADEYHAAWEEAQADLKKSKEEQNILLSENAALKSSSSHQQVQSPIKSEETKSSIASPETVTESSTASPLMTKTKSAGEAVLANIGSLKLYEILLGLVFISVIISWNPYY